MVRMVVVVVVVVVVCGWLFCSIGKVVGWSYEMLQLVLYSKGGWPYDRRGVSVHQIWLLVIVYRGIGGCYSGCVMMCGVQGKDGCCSAVIVVEIIYVVMSGYSKDVVVVVVIVNVVVFLVLMVVSCCDVN